MELEFLVSLGYNNVQVVNHLDCLTVGGPAIADRSYPSAGSPALRILSE